jgi:proteasome lid subunit RPN8/RPN11
MRAFGRDFLSFGFDRIRQGTTGVQQVKPIRTQIKPALPETAARPSIFLANSLFLHECFAMLTRTEAEDVHAVTGSVIGNLRTLDRIIPLQLSLQCSVGAEAENGSLADAFIRLNDFGLLPLAYFHSHPGYGVQATQPSGTDRQTQETMEKSGSEIIGGIFSRDGFVRFYSNRKVPNVRVLGKRVKKVEQNVYKLEIEENI